MDGQTRAVPELRPGLFCPSPGSWVVGERATGPRSFLLRTKRFAKDMYAMVAAVAVLSGTDTAATTTDALASLIFAVG